MPHAADMEMKAWIVRCDGAGGAKPVWLKMNVMKSVSGKFDITNERRIAHQFDNYDEAKRVASEWTSAMGAWHVERAT